MPYEFTQQGQALLQDVVSFMDDHIYPNEAEYHEQARGARPRRRPADPRQAQGRRPRARACGTCSCRTSSPDAPGTKLSNLDYAPISEQLGKVGFASEALNCAAPDTGNMEILNALRLRDGQARLAGPAARGRDPLGVLDDRARRRLVGRHQHRPAHRARRRRVRAQRHEVVLVGRAAAALQGAHRDGQDRPRRAPAPAAVDDRRAQGHAGHPFGRTPHVFGYDHAGGHPEVIYEDVRVPVDNLLGEEGGGFAISQARLGPGRIHHCMRSIGVAERALGLMIDRALRAHARSAPSVAQKGLIQDWIAESRIEIDMAREYVLRTAHLMDTVGNKAAATEISGHQGRRAEHGAARSSTGPSRCTAPPASRSSRRSPRCTPSMRTLRIADGPDEVHKMTIARREILQPRPDVPHEPRCPTREGPRGRTPALRPSLRLKMPISGK